MNPNSSSKLRAIIALVVALYATTALSQSTENAALNDQSTQLNVVQSVLEAKLSSRTKLRENIVTAAPDAIADIEKELLETNAEIADLRDSFEQIAVGSVDLGVFSDESGEFDFKNEITQVMLPIIRNLQSLTEKPRKIEALRSQISTAKEQLAAAKEALVSIEENISLSNDATTQASLTSLQASWLDRSQELGRNMDVAIVKLANLQKSDGNILLSLKTNLVEFFVGRGLTIVLAIAVVMAVWFAAKFLSKLLLKRNRKQAVKSYRTRQRLVEYGFNILTGLLMLVAVIVVFYIRGDVLLLGISFIVGAAALLGLRHTIPKFISEARLLLNLGSIREGERVVYNGLPFRVVSLNMYSILKNPELTGIIRLPLDSLIGMVSRPAGKEMWFPASKGDYIMLPDDKMLEVLELTTELIHLQNLAGTKTSIPAADFYNMTFDNLSRGESFAVIGAFGVGYKHQAISNKSIPTVLQQSVTDALAKTDFSEHVVSVDVELKEAGASSLDYFVCVVLSSDAVRSYYSVNRIVQQTCIGVCTKEQWDIPFPQLKIHS